MTGVQTCALPISDYNIPPIDDDWNNRLPSFEFSEGLAAFYDNISNKIGFINKQGKVKITALYDDVGIFSEGAAYAAILGDKFPGYLKTGDGNTSDNIGYIDSKGRFLFTLPDSLINLTNGCYFHGEPFDNGEALMYITENGADCAGDYPFYQMTIDKKGQLTETVK